jgi:hypothetical protein
MLRRACAPELLDVEKEAVKIQANVRSWLLQRNYRNLRLSVTRFQAGVSRACQRGVGGCHCAELWALVDCSAARCDGAAQLRANASCHDDAASRSVPA